MKQAFAICALLFALMYVAALYTLRRPANDGIVRLRWATDANPARTVQVALFHRMNPGIDATVDPNPAGDASKLIVQCSTGTGPDIIDLGQDTMSSLVEAGVLLDLTPYARSMGFDPSRTYPAVKENLEADGRQYRFPCNVFANAVIYNKRIFDDHGVPYPKTGWNYDDFVRTAKLILDRPSTSGEKHLAVANWLNTWFFEDLLVGHGGRLFTPDGLHSALDSPEAVAAMQSYYNMMYVDRILPTPADSAAMSSQGGWGSGGLNWFSEGKAAMILIGRWYIVQLPNFPDLQGHLGAVTLPRVDGRPSSGFCGARATGINVNSPHREQALRFLQYLASPEYARIIDSDGDSLPPNPALARTGADLINEAVPDPDFHQAFIDAIRSARSLDYSPFEDAAEVERWIQEFIEKVENRILPPREAMRTLANQIDRKIRLNLERRPDLQRKYERIMGRKYRADW